MVRLATNPYKIDESLAFARHIKKEFNMEVALNLMYFGIWIEDNEFLSELNRTDTEFVDYVYFVDSYGSVMPSQLGTLREDLPDLFGSVSIGFHGHNNQEMALANSLEMIKRWG